LRNKGDRLIREVNQKLIAPLRKVYDDFLIEMSELQHVAQNKRRQENFLATQREKEDEEERRVEAEQAYKQKLAWWQYLEVVRLECEPHHHRRRVLAPPKKERDANGMVFDRLPIFLPRNTPPPLTSSKLREWSDEQSMILAEALQKHAGKCMQKASKCPVPVSNNPPRASATPRL